MLIKNKKLHNNIINKLSDNGYHSYSVGKLNHPYSFKQDLYIIHYINPKTTKHCSIISFYNTTC